MSIKIRPSQLSEPGVQALIQQLDAYLSIQYADYESARYGLKAEELEPDRSGCWVADCLGQAVGCVAIRPYTPFIAELKRLYVLPQFREQGIGSRLLETAEAAAIAWGYQQICLETGDRQPASIRLYRRCGFQAIPCFGDYTDPASRCYRKWLNPANHQR